MESSGEITVKNAPLTTGSGRRISRYESPGREWRKLTLDMSWGMQRQVGSTKASTTRLTDDDASQLRSHITYCTRASFAECNTVQLLTVNLVSAVLC